MGHTSLRDYLKKLKLSDDDLCKETGHHILYECEALASKRLKDVESTFKDPGEYHDVSKKNAVCFIVSTSLTLE
jgi:hypothetical protein